ncbi:hypothetical protein TSUD_204300 [Trifolium subterraneum]|uniref:Uncharacterized protein n=1 Tax=Trifolium subterraneum TaxID=3900 RepID=A0A2Z6P658_TRISU|nr:hypothetical protein TSUD_204300 [Trifolium subterraneum]
MEYLDKYRTGTPWNGYFYFTISFDTARCLKVIELLDSCCSRCDYNSTHCASLSGLLKQNSKFILMTGLHILVSSADYETRPSNWISS